MSMCGEVTVGVGAIHLLETTLPLDMDIWHHRPSRYSQEFKKVDSVSWRISDSPLCNATKVVPDIAGDLLVVSFQSDLDHVDVGRCPRVQYPRPPI
jgi:hypothetical protein